MYRYGEADPCPPCPRSGQLDRNQRKADRDLRDLTETTRPTTYLVETSEGLVEDGQDHGNLAEGRHTSC